jgi:hypothetical protein
MTTNNSIISHPQGNNPSAQGNLLKYIDWWSQRANGPTTLPRSKLMSWVHLYVWTVPHSLLLVSLSVRHTAFKPTSQRQLLSLSNLHNGLSIYEGNTQFLMRSLGDMNVRLNQKRQQDLIKLAQYEGAERLWRMRKCRPTLCVSYSEGIH